VRSGASTPEELESLFEDALVVGDLEALAQLFVDGAVMVRGGEARAARGGQAIARSAAAMGERGYAYVAEPRLVLQARDTALVVAAHGVNVVRRGSDGRWRFAISLLDMHSTEGDAR